MSNPSQKGDDSSPQQKRIRLEQLLKERASQNDASFPLSHGQRSMWFLHQLDPDGAAYNTGFAVRIRSAVDIPALRRSLQRLLERHSALRMKFVNLSGEPVQRLQPRAEPHFELADASAWTAAEMDARVHAAYRHPFDLENGPLLRAYLFSRSAAEHVLLLAIHHIAIDGWSFWILIDELLALYKAEKSGLSASLPQLAMQHTDFVDWQLRMLAGPDGERMWHYWQKQLAGRLPILNLPTDRPRPARLTFSGASHSFEVPGKATQALKALAAKEGATLFMVLWAAYALLLQRYAGQDDILVGSPVTGRSRAEFAGIVGDFINMVVLRADLSGNPRFKDFLAGVRRTVLGSLEHQDFPFPLLVDRLGVPRDPHLNPVFQSIFIFQKPQRLEELLEVFDTEETNAHVDIGGLTLESYPLRQQEGQFDLSLEMMEARGSIIGKLKYNTDLFDRATIERMAGHFRILLEGIAADPSRRLSELPLLSAAERERVVVEWNGTGSEYRRDEGLARLFEAQAERTPDAVAVVHGDRHLTYAELNRRANRMAHYLRRQGIGPDDLVGICLERSPDMMVGLLGIVKAGGAYVPLDPDFPRERLRFMLEDSGAAVLVTQAALEEGLPEHRARVISLDREGKAIEGESDENPVYRTKAEDLAYVIYTSGSTGKPKGVQIPHGALTNFLQAMKREPGIGADDVLLAVTTLSFDIAGLELYLPLTVGGRVVIAGRDVASDGIRLARLLGESRATVMQATPASWKLLRAAGWKGDGRLRMLCGGEALPMELAKELLGAGGELWNMYGPTETTIWSTVARVTGGEERIHIGRPIANTRVYILDGHGQPAPVGVPGELHIGGDGLARGYLKRPELDEEKFVPDAFSGDPKSRLYRTGDLARWQADGTIECLGRIDNQVKVRGYRIELGEIEAVLREQAGVKDAVVAALEEQGGEKRLVGYVVAADGADPDVAGLRRLLKAKLPDYMIPASFVRLEAFPLTPNGKIDRRALPAPEAIRQSEESFVAPRDETERRLAVIWQELLRIPRIGVLDSFFELGGNSLRAIEVAFRIHEAFKVELPLSLLFQNQTIASLAAVLAEGRKDPAMGGDAPSLPISELNLAAMLEPKPDERYKPFPLTDVQEAYWLGRAGNFEIGNVGSHAYWEADFDDLDLARYERTWQRMIERHDMLRAIVLLDGRQQILKDTPPFRIHIDDLRGTSAEAAGAVLASARQSMSHFVFSGDQWPLFEIRAFQLGDHRYRLYFSFDLLIGDAWSFQVILKDFAYLYDHPEGQLPPLRITFRDYVFALAKFRETDVYKRNVAYWDGRLKTLPHRPELSLAKDPETIKKPRFERRIDRLEAKLWESLGRRAKTLGLTENSILLAAYADVLGTWSRRSHFLLNLTLFNRLPIHPEVNDLIGDFTTITLLEVQLSPAETFLELARKLLDRLWTDLDNRHVSGVQVLRKLAHEHPDRISGVAPIVFTSTLGFGGQKLSPGFLPERGEFVYGITQTPQVWIDQMVSVQDGELVICWDAVDELFPPGMVDDMFQSYMSHLRRLAGVDASWLESRSERAEILMPGWQARQRASVNETGRSFPEDLMHVLFEKQARRDPLQTAIVHQDVRITYSELEQMSRRIGHQLRSSGAKPNSLVAIVMDKGWEQVVAALAVLQSGAAYVPVDSHLPRERLHQLLRDAQVKMLLTQPEWEATLEWPGGIKRLSVERGPKDQGGALPLEPAQGPSDLAYVIYTSGSTGSPKGVMIDHRGAVNTIFDINQRFRVGPGDRVFALSSLSFDLSVYDIFGTLAAGGTIIIPEASAARDPSSWLDIVRREGVTLWNSVPALMEMCVEHVEGRSETLPPSLRLVLMSGDWIPVTLPSRISALSKDLRIFSLGGATEASIWSIFFPIDRVEADWKSIPYGRPMMNQSFQVLNEALERCPVWVPGQLYIGGIGLAKGYWGDPEKTKAKFITHPRSGERLYFTGDLGRYLPGGDIEFLGREDFQVKIRGFRIELGEIEAALQLHPGVRAAVVTAVGKSIGERRLVAYVVPERGFFEGKPVGEDARPEKEPRTQLETELRAFLAEKLPEHMIPPCIVRLEGLPLTANGKVDYRSLPEPDALDLGPRSAHVAPRDEDERHLAGMWQEVLHIDDVGIHDNFFELGGDSVSAVQVISRANKKGYQLTALQIFRFPTIAELAKMVHSSADQEAGGVKGEGEGIDPTDLLRKIDQMSESEIDEELGKRERPGAGEDPK